MSKPKADDPTAYYSKILDVLIRSPRVGPPELKVYVLLVGRGRK